MGYVAGKRLKWGDGYIEIGEPVPDDEPWRRYDRMLATGEIVIGEGGPPSPGAKPAPSPTPAGGRTLPGGFDEYTKAEMTELAESWGIVDGIEGTGSGGNVLKADIEGALREAAGSEA